MHTFDSGVRARATLSADPNVLRDRHIGIVSF